VRLGVFQRRGCTARTDAGDLPPSYRIQASVEFLILVSTKSQYRGVGLLVLWDATLQWFGDFSQHVLHILFTHDMFGAFPQPHFGCVKKGGAF